MGDGSLRLRSSFLRGQGRGVGRWTEDDDDAVVDLGRDGKAADVHETAEVESNVPAVSAS